MLAGAVGFVVTVGGAAIVIIAVLWRNGCMFAGTG